MARAGQFRFVLFYVFEREETEISDDAAPRARYGEAFWRAHHEAWKCSDLNQPEYCEAQGLSLKAIGNRRAKFTAEPQPPARAGHRRRFSETDRRHILAEAAKPGASISAVARRYGIARRVLYRWRQEQAATATPGFVEVEIVDAPGGGEAAAP